MRLALLTVSIFLLLQFLLAIRPEVTQSETLFISPSKNVKQFSFGYQTELASLFWVRALQDIDVCDQNRVQQALPAFDPNEKDKVKEILQRELPPARCDKGWVYQMLDLTTDLAPDFYGAFFQGSTMLSVLVDDRKGASALFRKGVRHFPEDWELIYRAAYHELFEMQEPEKAATLLKKAGERGAPRWVYALSSKLYTKLGRAAFAKSILEDVLKKTDARGTHVERVRAELDRVNQILIDAQ